MIRRINFKPATLALIHMMRAIVDEYRADDLVMTARQLYYQLVSRNVIANTEREYKRVTKTLTDARYAGLIAWDAIEDRNRPVWTPAQWDSVGDLAAAAASQFRLPRWKDQPKYVELWVEKAALAGVLQPLASRFHVPLMVNRGYSSASAMKESADRFIAATQPDDEEGNLSVRSRVESLFEWLRNPGDGDDEAPINESIAEQVRHLCKVSSEYTEGVRPSHLLYLGDLDPSGEDMVRDIEERLVEFGVINLTVTKLGLTHAQVRSHRPPPNPAKVTDPRARKFIQEHGASSWEVDALEPRVLQQLITAEVQQLLDNKLWKSVIKEEDRQRALLDRFAKDAGKS